MLNRKEFLRQMGSVSASLAMSPMPSCTDRQDTLEELAEITGTSSQIATRGLLVHRTAGLYGRSQPDKSEQRGCESGAWCSA